MSSAIIIGNTAPTETWHDEFSDEIKRKKIDGLSRSQTLFVVRHGDPFAGMAEIEHAYVNHHSYDPPAWVTPVGGDHADMLAQGVAIKFSTTPEQHKQSVDARRQMRRDGASDDELPEIIREHSVALQMPSDWYDADSNNIEGPTALKTNLGNDQQAKQMGGDVYPVVGTSSAISATTLTTNQNYAVNALAGHWVQTGGAYAVIISNTVGPNSVLTIDKWYDPANPGGTALATPATGAYVVIPGGAPFAWMAITTDATTTVATDTALASELALSGLTRKLATYGHTTGAASHTLSGQFTNPDSTPRTINRAGLHYGAGATATMGFGSAVPSPPVLASSTDSTTITETVTE